MGRKITCFRFLPGFLVFLSFLALCSGAEAESFTGKTPLEPGPYGVGFESYELFDNNRTVLSKYDYFGAPLEGKRVRPIQICVWYPAEKTVDAPKMIIGEYNFPYPQNTEFIDYLSEIQNRDVGRLQAILRGDQGLVLDLLSYEVGACSDIPHAGGKFKMIVCGPDMRKGILENSGLFEYLASNGLVVATVHSVGSFDLNPSENPADLETLVRDTEFAMSFMKEQPYIDSDRICLLGYGTGAAAAILLQMRSFDIDAVVCVQGTFDDESINEIMTRNPYFAIDRMNVPLLHLYKETGTSAGDTFIKRLRYSPRHTVKFAPDYDVLFTNYELIASLKQDSTGQLSRQNIDGYKTSSLYALNFFRAHLSEDSTARSFLDDEAGESSSKAGFLTVAFHPGDEIPPTESQFMSIINERGVETAAQLYRKFKPSNPDHVFFREFNINILGYRYLQTGRGRDALTLFELNADAFPTSANAWDSYGEACMAIGDYPRALENYRKALEILPQDTNITEELRNLIRENAPQQIARLEELIRESSE
ncbi:MAG: tetratricopeptide repeat protein [Candidatus Zixiibacteriota bacterium]|nr:MAG: tetratricopeptide repeat protein [candidate division Zixibacteria bacterium]